MRKFMDLIESAISEDFGTGFLSSNQDPDEIVSFKAFCKEAECEAVEEILANSSVEYSEVAPTSKVISKKTFAGTGKILDVRAIQRQFKMKGLDNAVIQIIAAS